MSFGFSHKFAVDINARFKKQPNDPVLELAYLCVKHSITMSETARILGVSRQAMYKWFEGEYSPNTETQDKIIALVVDIKKKHVKV